VAGAPTVALLFMYSVVVEVQVQVYCFLQEVNVTKATAVTNRTFFIFLIF